MISFLEQVLHLRKLTAEILWELKVAEFQVLPLWAQQCTINIIARIAAGCGQ